METIEFLGFGLDAFLAAAAMRIGLLMDLSIFAANIFIINIVYPLTPLP